MGLAAGKRFYFWGRIVALNGEIGAWYPGDQGVMGESSWEASEILEYLNGKISRDELAQELTGTIDGLTSGLDETRAAITAEETKRADADGALSSRVDTVLAAANGAAAGVEETRNALVDVDGKLKATWSIKAQVAKDGKIYAAGMSAGAYSQPDGSMQTAVYFLADRLALLNQANGATTTPFVIENGQTFINDAVIGTSRITNAMIRSLDAGKIDAGYISVDRLDANALTAKLANLDKAYISRAHIREAQVDTLSIAGNAVTIPVSWAGTNSGSVVLVSNVEGPAVIIAYRGGYPSQPTALRIYANGEEIDRVDPAYTSTTPNEGGGLLYNTMPLSVMAVKTLPAGSSVITVNSAHSYASGAPLRLIVLMTKR
ncbi:DUF1983 domain-containing protein [Achromobacter ruhlandii]